MPLTLVFPPDRPGDATYASLAAQVEVGLARAVCDHRSAAERRRGDERRHHNEPLPVGVGGQRAIKRRRIERRQAVPLAVSPRIVVTA